ncbi:MAG: hypothetical protein KDE27_04385 [Planctomycetes bacterium]|nr:hypothetical protein [Planctomycetota bacterium]
MWIEELVFVPAAVYGIAPDAAVRICGQLLDHPDQRVVEAVVRGPLLPSPQFGVPEECTVPGGGEFAGRIAEVLTRMDAQTPVPIATWFSVLEHGADALPRVRTALRERPDSPVVVDALRRLLSPEEFAKEFAPGFVAQLATDRSGFAASVLRDVQITDPQVLAALERVATDPNAPGSHSAKALLAEGVSESEFADTSRRERLTDPRSDLGAVPLANWTRLWPILTFAEQESFLSRMGGFGPHDPLPTVLAAAGADRLVTRGQSLSWLVLGAPLEPRVVEVVDAAERFWNPPGQGGGCSLPDYHVWSLVGLWPEADPRTRERILERLRRHPDLAANMALRPLLGARGRPRDRRLSTLEYLELVERVPLPRATLGMLEPFHDDDRAVRRAALRAFAVASPDRERAVRLAHKSLRGREWEDCFGPTEGLPPAAAEIATALSSPTKRAARLRALLAEEPDNALQIARYDPAAALQLLPEFETLLTRRPVIGGVLACLRGLGPDAAALLPAVEALTRIPTLHFEVEATARILRGEAPREAMPSPTEGGPGGSSWSAGPWPRYR